jgi:hypothetical protein
MDQNKTSDSSIGYGIIDLDPILNAKTLKTELRCFINYENKPAGFVLLYTEFK